MVQIQRDGESFQLYGEYDDPSFGRVFIAPLQAIDGDLNPNVNTVTGAFVGKIVATDLVEISARDPAVPLNGFVRIIPAVTFLANLPPVRVNSTPSVSVGDSVTIPTSGLVTVSPGKIIAPGTPVSTGSLIGEESFESFDYFVEGYIAEFTGPNSIISRALIGSQVLTASGELLGMLLLRGPRPGGGSLALILPTDQITG